MLLPGERHRNLLMISQFGLDNGLATSGYVVSLGHSLTFSSTFSCIKIVVFWFNFPHFFPIQQWANLVLIMVWCQKATSHYLHHWLCIYICIYIYIYIYMRHSASMCRYVAVIYGSMLTSWCQNNMACMHCEDVDLGYGQKITSHNLNPWKSR